MSLFWKIFWTVVIIITGAVSMAAVVAVWDAIIGLINGDASTDFLGWILMFAGAILAAIPAWFAWKGTKLIPFITILPVRIIMIVVGCLFLPLLLVVFALIGIWLKS